MPDPSMIGPMNSACGGCGACGICGACGPSKALLVAGVTIAALVALGG